MGRPRQPISMTAHRSKTEIAQRIASETLIPYTGEIMPPKHLSAAQARHFIQLATSMSAMGIYDPVDASQLALYIIASDIHIKLSLRMLELLEAEPEDIDLMCKLSDMAYRSFKNCLSAAQDLGLTPMSRRKLNINITATEPEPLSGIALFMSNRENESE